MKFKDALQWAVILGVLATPLGWVVHRVVQGQRQHSALFTAVERLGWRRAEPAASNVVWSIEGTSGGGPFRIDLLHGRPSASARRLVVGRAVTSGADVVLVGPAGPSLFAPDGPIAGALLPAGALPLRWSRAPVALTAGWDVLATEGAGERWLRPAAVEALLTTPLRAHAPVMELRGGHLSVRFAEEVPAEATLVSAVALLDAFCAAPR